MGIVEILEKRSSNHNELANKFKLLGDKILKDTIPHLKQINSILPEFDNHDESHSNKVLENIEKLIGEDHLNQLNSVELFLLWMSSYLHDIGMALPEWELCLLKKTEGSPSIEQNRDFLPPYKFVEANDFIKSIRNELYDKFSKTTDFLFGFDIENNLLDYLSNTLIEYQKYRNGFADKFTELLDDSEKYIKFSDNVRTYFIRDTHHLRSEKYILNLKKIFEEFLGGKWSHQLVIDLAKICRHHGEDFKSSNVLNNESVYITSETANLEFSSLLLRIGDILHYNLDRASKSLFSEKLILNDDSTIHWISKFNTGVNYSILQIGKNNENKTIQFSAFCENPKEFYFINDYIDGIEKELLHYYDFIQKMRYNLKAVPNLKKYDINLPVQISRDSINFDSSVFTPVNNLKFTLEQNQIIELLMGVNLYKDEKLSIRELFQNSLDSCKVMNSISKNHGYENKGIIKFGIYEKEDNESNSKYLYCIDNGTGMNKHIIEKYFLIIGNSYYKSKEFIIESIANDNHHKPISQFGIGILSCFMIGYKFEITTKTLKSDPICFSIDGPHERFYYTNPDQRDLEKIGDHGTLIKVFLNDKYSDYFSDTYIEDVYPMIYVKDKNIPNKTNIYNNHLWFILMEIIGDLPNDVDVFINCKNNRSIRILSRIQALNLYNYSNKDFDEIFKMLPDEWYNSEKHNLKSYREKKNNIESYVKKIHFDGIEVSFIINLPKTNDPNLNPNILQANNIYNSRSLLIGGISTNENASKFNLYTHYFSLVINFLSNKPQLSIDRKNITYISDSTKKAFIKIPQTVCSEICKIVDTHLTKYNLHNDSTINCLIWQYLSKEYSFILPELHNNVSNFELFDVSIENFGSNLVNSVTLKSYFTSKRIEFKTKDFHYNYLDNFSKYLFIGASINADNIVISEDKILIQNSAFDYTNAILGWNERVGDKTILIKCDTWCKKYSDFDIVTSFFPLVSEGLFDKIIGDYEQPTKRSKKIYSYSNTLSGITDIDPTLVDIKMGISSKDTGPRKNSNSVRNFYHFKKNIHFPELLSDRFEDHPSKTKRDFFIYVFVSPRKLNTDESLDLERYKDSEPEYYLGVKNGWSIMFLGNSYEMIIKPDVVSRDEMLKNIDDTFKNKYKDYSFSFIDDIEIKF